MIAPNNQDAVAWIDRWPDWPAPCLIIHGPAACGKSHLATVWQNRSGAAAIDTAAIASRKARAIAQAGNNLVLDNIDPWFGDHDAETTLFHLYNIMREEGRTMLLTMRMAPVQARFTLPDLASRLRAAPAAAIQPPDDTLLAALLVKLFADRQITPSHDVLDYILPRMERSFAAASTLVEAADRLALSEKRGISVPLMRRVLIEQNH